MTSLDIDRETRVKLPRVNWGVVVTVAIAVVGWLIAAGSGMFTDYGSIRDRVTVLETQRAGDKQQMDRVESKLDRLLERVQ